MTVRVYLDWNATAPLRREARQAMLAAADLVGNPSSVHAEGRAARQAIERARESVAALVGGDPRCVTFTSGGTEANALALTPAVGSAGTARRGRLLVSAIEHPSVLAGGRFPADMVEHIPVTYDGIVDLAALDDQLTALQRDNIAPLVSIMLANNETGVIQPVAEAAAMVHDAGGLLHVDAVQAAGRMPIDINALGADLMTISAHKIGGPKGVGALIRRDRSVEIADPLIRGGGQEQNLRAGTENVAAIAGFGAAALATAQNLPAELDHMLALRDEIEHYLSGQGADLTIFGMSSKRIPNTTLFALRGAKAETAVIALDLAGTAVSSGSACSSGKVGPSHVLAAMSVPAELARGAVRLSIGPETTESDVESFQTAWNKVLGPLLKEGSTVAA